MNPLYAIWAKLSAVALIFTRGWLMATRKKQLPSPPQLVVWFLLGDNIPLLLKEKQMKRISNKVKSFILSVLALSSLSIQAAVDGAISAVSDNPGVLVLEQLPGGRFKCLVMGVGSATVTISADADLGDDVRTISKVFTFVVYDSSDEADHFELNVSDIEYLPVVATEQPTDTATNAAVDAAATDESSTTS